MSPQETIVWYWVSFQKITSTGEYRAAEQTTAKIVRFFSIPGTHKLVLQSRNDFWNFSVGERGLVVILSSDIVRNITAGDNTPLTFGQMSIESIQKIAQVCGISMDSHCSGVYKFEWGVDISFTVALSQYSVVISSLSRRTRSKAVTSVPTWRDTHHAEKFN
jgi:hypothetical protein